jgi:ATP-binding cassette subfamily B protein
MNYFPRVLRYLKPYWKLAIVSGLLIGVATCLGLIAPWPMKILIDHVLEQKPLTPWLALLLGPLAENPQGLLLVAVLGGLGLTAFQNATKVIDNYVNTRIDQAMVLDFRSQLFEHAQRLSLAFHDNRRTGKVIFAINNTGGAIAELVTIIPPIVQSLLTLVGMFCIVLVMDWQLALLSMTVVPFLYLSVANYMKNVHHEVQKVRSMEAEMLSMVHEAMSMLRVVVAFGREDYEHRRFRDHGVRTVGERVKVTVRQTMFSLVINTTTAAGTALVLGVGAWHVLDGTLTVGELLVVMAYIAAVYSPMETLSTSMGTIQQIAGALKGSFDLLDTEVEVKDRPTAQELGRVRGQITFENVSFNYSGRKGTLKNVSLDVAPGRLVAVVGPTGAGKTTLVSLIPRFYEPQHGRILLDGVDLREIKLKSLREQFSLVLQESLLFSTSITENIRYGRFDASMEEVIEAAKAANAHDFIMRLPQQYNTKLGERGAKLSGGERQRISVARAFLKNAPILILDEPTSSIDAKTEAVILDAIDRLMIGRTTFMIAHRLSSIRHADLILVLNQGEIIEQGRHEELMEADGLYRQLHDMQQRQRRVTQTAVFESLDASDPLRLVK